MVTERTKKKLLDLYDSILNGDLSSRGEVSKQMFFSRASVIISEELGELNIQITALEKKLNELTKAPQ